MRFYTGDEAGLIKRVDIDPKVSFMEAQAAAAKKTRLELKAKAAGTKNNGVEHSPDSQVAGVNVWAHNGTVSRSQGIQQMSTGAGDDQVFVVGRKNGRIELVSKADGGVLHEFSEPGFSDPLEHNGKATSERRYVGVAATNTHFVSCTNAGEIRYQAFASGTAKLLRLQPDTWRMRVHNKHPILAVGGRDQELSIWDAETVGTEKNDGYQRPTCEPLFRSKNVPNDKLDMRVPVWVTDIRFLNDNALSPQLAVSTGHKQIRIYDTKARQRPVHNWEAGKHPIYHLLASHTKPELFFADNMGGLQQLDMRMGKVVGGYKGIAGAVKSIALSEDGTKVAAAGLDRFLRVYEADGMRRLLHRAYIKQRVSHVVWDWDVRDLSAEEIERQEVDEIWDNMERLEGAKAKRAAAGSKRKTAAVEI
ncbi:Ribosome biogenesis protein nsa1 (NOP7-associated protein 1) [Coemansia spiralis]|uniref:Ribosome biogenesis protein nsa1 (NOP7-associated protein 1) n=2 Tax=Coemansia TaxID=4863 RepID=A0A9W8GAY1_9FUNG|nr:Ribosome biogenesis protein nsa1 (NOP7-associated protein 1) [Coemansia umbellata]KAJ2624521.1 Ribosome biogenesis protein nsa1 (NOP7-associated protein 1) [Coemansia sp. RSA 1358]KAJ2679513.1 Ribosome biogenesis protein nsa1 (NOP7-associated protein 1) [Coemansia spiralis]